MTENLTIEQLKEEIRDLKAELVKVKLKRDQAIDELAMIRSCQNCAMFKICDLGCAVNCITDEKEYWVWRGDDTVVL
jgi:radical SAM protein with 4Fe4S-binding SPASM domain